MLRMIPIASATHAMDYFRRALSRGEYYTKDLEHSDQELPGLWGGEGAQRLGLAGEVEREHFERLCKNLHPQTGDPLTPRTKANRRVGYDLNFHVPKSVSLALELGGDERILGVFRDAVTATMSELEANARTRVRIGGADSTRQTGNLVYAGFIHRTARPVGGEPDPHLHQHCVVFNATYDGVEQRWKAADLGDIKRDAPYFQAAFHARMAEGVRGLGYGVERTATGWEISGVSKEMIDGFSRRTGEIEKLAKERGIEDPAKKAELGARSRQKKQGDLSMESLREGWRDRPHMAGARQPFDRAMRSARERPSKKPIHMRDADAAASLRHAKDHVFERESVVPERRLKALALEHGVGKVNPASVKKSVDGEATRTTPKPKDRSRLLRKTEEGRAWVSTPSVLDEERRMLRTITESRGMCEAISPGYMITDAELSDEQQLAVKQLLSSTDSTLLMRGRAGVGKTRTMKEIAKAIESSGKRLTVAAPTGMATHEVLRKDGFENAQTVARLLGDTELRNRLKGGVLWVDEAGLVSVPDMQKLVRLAKDQGARLLLTGDTAQHRSVIRGDALRLIEDRTGIPAARLNEIRRQHHAEYKSAVGHLAKGDLATGFRKLDRMDAIKEHADTDSLDRALAQTYAERTKEGHTTLIVAPTHAEGRAVTEAVRETLIEEGSLGDEETTVTRLIPRHLTEAQRRDSASYEVGDVVEFVQHAGHGFRRGQRFPVTAVEEHGVSVSTGNDETRHLPTDLANRFAVYAPQEMGLRVGDRVRMTRPGQTADKRHRLHNGALYGVAEINDEGAVTLDNGWTINSDHGHLAHGYCVTSDAAQGRTVDHVILAQSSRSAGASSGQQFYTSVSRGRKGVTIFTDDKEDLLRNVGRDATRVTATEMFEDPAGLGMHPPGVSLTDQQRLDIGIWNGRRIGERLKEAFTRRHEKHQSIERGRSHGPKEGPVHER